MTSVLKNETASPLKKEKFFYKHRFVFVAFVIPFVLMTYAFACSDFFPFGSNQIMVIDSWHQFFPFLKILQEKLQSFGSLLYTWQGGGGSNFIALISYYAASPLNILTIFFPAEYLTEAMALLTILKISLSSAFMFIYLREIYKKDDMGIVAFSVLYGLSAFAMGYYWCIMWLDCMALLPLCMLGLNKLIDEGKFKLYTITLALIMISNYYIGVMICIFTALYYPVLYFSRKERKGAKYCAITTGKAIGFSLLGCLMAAIILIPTYLSMQNTYYIDQQFPQDNNFYNNILDVISNLLPNVTLTVRGGLPNIYCGMLSFMMAVLFLLCNKISGKKKALYCIILGFLIISFNWNKLDFIWHGMHFPNELPYRYSFVFSFLLVTMAAEAYKYLKSITPRQIGCVAGGGIVYLIFAQKIYSETFDYKVIYVSIALIAIYAIVLGIFKTGRVKQAICGLMLFIVVFGEMTSYTVSSVKTVGNSNRDTYYTNYDDVEALIDKVESEDTGFYRMEVFNSWTCNDPALYGYNGLTQFSSELNCKVSAMMGQIGLPADPGSNSFKYLYQTPVANAMLNLKYLIGRGQEVTQDPYLEKLYSSNSSTIYKSKYPLSIAYLANNDIKDWAPQDTNPFQSQNDFVWFTTGINTPVLNEIDNFSKSESSCENGSIGDYQGGVISCTTSGGTTTAHLVYTATQNQPVYVYTKVDGATSISARLESNIAATPESNRGSIVSVGKAAKGDKIYVDITFEDGSASDITCMVYGLDENVWNKAYEILSTGALHVENHSDTVIEGTITADRNGTLMTSIPYEKGWSAYVDGKKVKVNSVNNAFCCIELQEGKHSIKFSYIPAGFVAGTALTIFSIIALVALHFVFKKSEERKLRIALIENSDPFNTEETEKTESIETLVEETFNTESVDTDDTKPKTDENGDYII